MNFSFSLWTLWEQKNEKATPTNHSRKFSNFPCIFLPNGPHKTTFGIFENCEILMIFLFVFVNMGIKFNLKKKIEIFVNMWPYGVANFKTQLWHVLNQTFSEFSLWKSSEKFLIRILKIQISVF